MADLRTLKGAGAAHNGSVHWWRQRLTALLLLPLVVLLALCVATFPSLDYASLRDWIQSLPVSISLILLLGTMFYHAQLGLQIVIEDYVATHWRRILLIVVVDAVCILFAVTGVFAVIKIALST